MVASCITCCANWQPKPLWIKVNQGAVAKIAPFSYSISMKKIFALFALLILNACTSYTQSDVIRFHDADILETGTFVILPKDKQKTGLEYKEYARQIAEHMTANNFRQVATKDKADYALYFSYGLKRSEIHSESVPFNTTFHGGYNNGPFGYGRPYFGGHDVYTYTRYVRSFEMDIVDLKQSSGQNVVKAFEGQVTSVGESDNFFTVSKCMINAMFSGFPGENGEKKTVTVKASECVQGVEK